MVCTKKRPPDGGYFAMAKCAIRELVGKAEAEIFEMLDRRMDNLIETESSRVNGRR
jgi:hypothetical protein